MKLSRFIAAVLCGSLFVSGCSSVKEELKPVKLEPIKSHYLFTSTWRGATGSGQDARYARLQPALVDGILYAVDTLGQVSAWNAKSGKRLWKNQLKTAVGSGVGVTGDKGLVGTLDGRIIAFALADGQYLWEAQTSSEVLATPQGNGEVVITQAIDGRVFAFDSKDGRRLWNYDHPVPVLSLRSNAAPLISGNSALVAFDNGQILNFDAATGQLRWVARVGQPQGKTELERLVDVDSSPLEFGPYIYGAGYNSRLVAITKGTGRIGWTQDVSTAQNITAADNKILVSDADSHIKAFDALNGTLLWENDKLHRRATSAPAVFGDLVVVADSSGFLHGLSLEDGNLVARTRLPSEQPVFAQPLVWENTLYLLNKSGLLTALTAEKLERELSLWDMPTNRHKGAIPTKPTGVP
jgi:outer membrane protein assembly factor BamB